MDAPAHLVYQPRGQRALRPGRVSLHGQVYLLTAVTRHRRPLFREFHAARVVVSALRENQSLGYGRILAFVVMPDHVHWLLELAAPSLGRAVDQFKGSASRHLARLNPILRRPWQRAYHDHALRRDENLVAAAHYIIANPLRARLVHRLGDYPHWDSQWLPGPDDVPL